MWQICTVAGYHNRISQSFGLFWYIVWRIVTLEWCRGACKPVALLMFVSLTQARVRVCHILRNLSDTGDVAADSKCVTSSTTICQSLRLIICFSVAGKFTLNLLTQLICWQQPRLANRWAFVLLSSWHSVTSTGVVVWYKIAQFKVVIEQTFVKLWPAALHWFFISALLCVRDMFIVWLSGLSAGLVIEVPRLTLTLCAVVRSCTCASVTEHQCQSRAVNRRTVHSTGPVSMSCSFGWCLSERHRIGEQRPRGRTARSLRLLLIVCVCVCEQMFSLVSIQSLSSFIHLLILCCWFLTSRNSSQPILQLLYGRPRVHFVSASFRNFAGSGGFLFLPFSFLFFCTFTSLPVVSLGTISLQFIP